MDLSVTQSYAVYQKITEGNADQQMNFFNFKRNICEHLITPLQNSHPVWRPAESRKTASKQIRSQRN